MKRLIPVLFILIGWIPARGQLDCTYGYTAMDLAETLVGGGITIVDATIDCYSQGFGLFECIDCNLGIDSGFILTTGKAINAEGPNNSGSLGYNTGFSGDPDLDALPGVGTTYDRCVFELDIIPECDTISFDYVFGSEEYNEYVGSINDAFAFWISGPGIVGAVNIALIPGTTLPVTIDNVNLGSYPTYYHNNTGVPTTDPYYIQYDGFTVPLTAISLVTPGETYHLKLAIADEADHVWDSGVFLRANSLSTSTTATFTFPDAGIGLYPEYCTTGVDPIPELATGAEAGIFSASPDGLVFVSDSTGEIDLSESIPGIYTIYNYLVVESCGSDTLVGTSIISIAAAPEAGFTYPGSPFCHDAASATITLDPGAEIGSFSASPTGLSINTATGAVNIGSSTPGTYTVTNTIPAGYGCPITTASTLIEILPTYDLSYPAEICDGETYVLPDGSSTGSPGEYVSSLTTAAGCDSIITIGLVVHSVFDVDVDAETCDGDTYYLPDGSGVTTAGTYSTTLSSLYGCDSVINTTLSLLPIPESSADAFICTGDFFTLPDGTVTSSGGVYTSVLTAASGCDSLVYTTLELWPVYSVDVYAGICSGTTYTLPDGSVVTGGFYSTTLSSITGCDSIINTTVEDLDVTYASVDAEICDGEEYILPDGSLADISGIYVSEYTTAAGCDSVITTNLTVNALPTLDFPLPEVVCYEDGIQLLSAEPAGGSFSGSFVSGSSFDIWTAGVGGPFAITYSYTDANGCFNDTIMEMLVDANEVSAFGSAEMIVGFGTPIWGITGGDFNWSPAEYVNCPTCDSTIANPTQSGPFVLTSYNENGCVADDEIYITVLPDPEDYSFVPNTITPNGDNINDHFTAYGPNLILVQNLQIYDRWGELLFSIEDYPANDPQIGWDGTRNGAKVEAGVYSYIMELKFIEGDRKTVMGNITVLR
jgi:gliding motility-associated-like protein